MQGFGGLRARAGLFWRMGEVGEHGVVVGQEADHHGSSRATGEDDPVGIGGEAGGVKTGLEACVSGRDAGMGGCRGLFSCC